MKTAIIGILSARPLGWFALALVSSALGTAMLGGVLIANVEQERDRWLLLQAAALLLAGWGIRLAHDDARNRLRDRDAAALVDQAQRSDPGPFVL